MMGRKYPDWLLVCFILGLGAGTVFVNLAGGEWQEQAGGMGKLMAGGFYLVQEEKWELVKAVAVQRSAEITFLVVMGLVPMARILYCVLSGILGIAVGAVLSVLTCEYGLMGLPVYVCSVFPQALFYIPVWLFLAGAAGRKIRIPVRFAVLGIVLMLAGIWSEGLVNPWIFHNIIP